MGTKIINMAESRWDAPSGGLPSDRIVGTVPDFVTSQTSNYRYPPNGTMEFKQLCETYSNELDIKNTIICFGEACYTLMSSTLPFTRCFSAQDLVDNHFGKLYVSPTSYIQITGDSDNHYSYMFLTEGLSGTSYSVTVSTNVYHFITFPNFTRQNELTPYNYDQRFYLRFYASLTSDLIINAYCTVQLANSGRNFYEGYILANYDSYYMLPTNNPDESQGNDGEYDLSSDPIPIPPAPIQGGTQHGFFSIFNPTDAQAQALANEFWSNNIIDQIAKAFYEPISTILGFGIVPVTMPNVGHYYVKLGNFETNIAMPKVEQRYIDVNCGTVNIVEFIGAFLDYSPYTRMQMYLPFIGYVPLDTDLFMKHNQTITTMGVTYRVDILTGACTAFVTANGNVYGQFGGNCLTQLPVTGSDYTRLAQALIGVATTAAGIGAQYQAYNQGMKQFEDKLNRKLDGGDGKNLPTPPVAPYSAKAHALSSVFDVISAKPNIRRGGSFAGAMGWLNLKKPHLLITLPIIDFPKGFNEYVGRPCNKVTKLENIRGYTVVNEINLQGIKSAYEAEIAEIDRLLKRGVIIK